MGVFDRQRRVIKANVNTAVAPEEDPKKILDRRTLAINQQLVEAEKVVTMTIADKHSLERQVADHYRQPGGRGNRQVLSIRAAENEKTNEAWAAMSSPVPRLSPLTGINSFKNLSKTYTTVWF